MGRRAARTERRRPFGSHLVEVLKSAAKTGGGSALDRQPRASVVWFRRDEQQRLGLDPVQYAVMRVQGETMAPTLVAGSSVLVDRSRTRRRDGQIFVVRTAEGMVVKRAARWGIT